MKRSEMHSDIKVSLLGSSRKSNEDKGANSSSSSCNPWSKWCLTILSLMVYISSIVIGLIGYLTNYIDFVSKSQLYFVLIGVSGYGMAQTIVQTVVTVKHNKNNNNNPHNDNVDMINCTEAEANTAPIIFIHDSTDKDNNNNSNNSPFDTNSVALGVEMSSAAHYSQVEPPHHKYKQASQPASLQEHPSPPSTDIINADLEIAQHSDDGTSQQYKETKSTIIGDFIASPVSYMVMGVIFHKKNHTSYQMGICNETNIILCQKQVKR